MAMEVVEVAPVVVEPVVDLAEVDQVVVPAADLAEAVRAAEAAVAPVAVEVDQAVAPVVVLAEADPVEVGEAAPAVKAEDHK